MSEYNTRTFILVAIAILIQLALLNYHVVGVKKAVSTIGEKCKCD